MKKLLEDLFKKGTSKKPTNLLPYFFALTLGVVLMFMGGLKGGGGKDEGSEGGALLELTDFSSGHKQAGLAEAGYERELEAKIEHVLSKAQGVGRVSVALKLSYKGEVELAEDSAYEETKDQTGQGLKTSVKKEVKNVILTGKDGVSSPVVIRQTEPKIEGVIIVAEGGGNADVRTSLIRAAGALLNLPAHKIEVLKMSKQ